VKSLEKLKNKNVLMTGGTGFFGKNITPFFTSAGCSFVKSVGSEYDLTKQEEAARLFTEDGVKFDLVIHAAAFQGAGDFTLKYPADQFMKNNLIHTHVLDCWHKFQPQARLVGIGSTCSYPGNLPVLREEDYFTGPLHESVDIYGLTKCTMQKGIVAYKRQYGLKGTTLVFATLFGPHDEFNIGKSHVVSALIKKFCDGTTNSAPWVEVWGDGTQTRELIYVDDQIEGLLSTFNYEGDLLNIGSGVETTISDLAEIIKEESGFLGKIVYNTERFVGVKKKVLDISLARESFGWSGGAHTLREGIKKSIDWYRNYYDKA